MKKLLRLGVVSPRGGSQYELDQTNIADRQDLRGRDSKFIGKAYSGASQSSISTFMTVPAKFCIDTGRTVDSHPNSMIMTNSGCNIGWRAHNAFETYSPSLGCVSKPVGFVGELLTTLKQSVSHCWNSRGMTASRGPIIKIAPPATTCPGSLAASDAQREASTIHWAS